MPNATEPQVGRSGGHERGVLMATSGHFCWPPTGSSDWPLTLRDGCLNINSFYSLLHARVVISDRKSEYNHDRRHSSLG